jgi:putative endonuclease
MFTSITILTNMTLKNYKKVEVGKIGEDAACEYLVKKGWKILKRNHRERSDEIDIIAIANDNTLVFCEVKALLTKNEFPGSGFMPEDNMTGDKLRKISRACRIFAGKHPELINEEKGWRIDLVAIDIGIDGGIKDIRHYENI